MNATASPISSAPPSPTSPEVSRTAGIFEMMAASLSLRTEREYVRLTSTCDIAKKGLVLQLISSESLRTCSEAYSLFFDLVVIRAMTNSCTTLLSMRSPVVRKKFENTSPAPRLDAG
jgi:hypothetical protein